MRTFRSSDGREWMVWKVTPQPGSFLERRRKDRRKESEAEHEGPERRAGADRRLGSGSLIEGWLCFESGGEKRRLCPVPADWETCPEQRLQMMWRAAAAARPPSQSE